MATDDKRIDSVPVSEQELARLALGYLKHHYKYRKRQGETTTRLGAHTASGLIADAVLSFQTDDDTEFLATVEATDYNNRTELQYQPLRDLLLVDSVTAAMVVLLAFLGFFYFQGSISVFDLGWVSSVALLVLVLLLLATLFFWGLRARLRYRYIYAIEQFKKYYADDQWVIFSETVFSGYEDPSYKELRRQCIRYGFGLLEVDASRKIKLLLSPARVDAIGRNRALFDFGNQRTVPAAGALSRLPGHQQLRRLLPAGARTTGLMRFRRTYYNQLAIMLVCVTLLAGLFYKEAQKAPVVYVNEDQYVNRQQALAKELAEQKNREGVFYFKIDSGVFVQRSRHYMAPSIVYDTEQEPITQAPVEQSVISEYRGGRFEDIPCTEYLEQSNNRYLIFFASYYQLDEAKQAAIQLRNNGIAANVGWAECFFDNRPFYLVFYAYFFINPERAEERVRALVSEIRKQGLVFEVGYSQTNR